MNSISPSFVNMIEPELGSSPAGPVVFYKIMNKVQMMSAEAMRKLEKELKELIVKQEPGKNIETFCNKIQGVAEKLDQGPDYKPVDLNLLVAENFIYCSVELFRIAAINLHALIQLDMYSHDWREILRVHTSKYISLIGSDLWRSMKINS